MVDCIKMMIENSCCVTLFWQGLLNILLRDPSEYMLSKRDVAMGGLEILIPGVTLLLMSVVIFTISITRSITLMHEGRAILRLDERIEKLEKNSKK